MSALGRSSSGLSPSSNLCKGDNAVITEKDLKAAIAECQGRRNPDANTCIKLAAFYTIQREMFGEDKEVEHYSYAPPPDSMIELDSGTEFARAINGRTQKEVLPILDELMTTLQVIQPRLYDAVINKLS